MAPSRGHFFWANLTTTHSSVIEETKLRLRVEDIRYDIQDSDALLAFAEEHFVEQNWFERKYMSFRLVDDPFPKRCRH